MKSNIVELARKNVIDQLFDTKTFKNPFEKKWSKGIITFLGEEPKADGVLDLGSELRRIFKSTSTSGRDQSQLSGGGSAWEGLICYYLNLCLIGTNSIVFKKRSHVPKCVQSALTVKHRTVFANSESDLVAISFPSCDSLEMELFKSESIRDRLDNVSEKYFSELRITVIQCKTNWNDNSQIPMLWDMIYHTEIFKDNRVTLGVDNYSFNQEKFREQGHFSYSFVTVPSNELDSFKDSSLCVKRVHELSGGNYWGCASKKGVASAPKEIFANNLIGPDNGRGLRESLEKNIKLLINNKAYEYFRLEFSC